MRILKDKILMRTKATTLTHLLRFLTGELDDYYVARLTSAATIARPLFQRSKYIPKGVGIEACDITKVCSSNESLSTETIDLHPHLTTFLQSDAYSVSFC